MSRLLSFDGWKEHLRNDCIACNKEREFNGLGECVLKILYQNGVDPTVRALVRDGLNGIPKPATSARKAPNVPKKSASSEGF